jgi:hypothetical protein
MSLPSRVAILTNCWREAVAGRDSIGQRLEAIGYTSDRKSEYF